LSGFDYDSAEEVRREALGDGNIGNKLDNQLQAAALSVVAPAQAAGLQRIGEVPIYSADAIARRAPSLQRTRDAAPPVAWLNSSTADKLGLRDGDFIRVRQGSGEAVVPYVPDDRLPADCMRLAAGRPETAGLGAMFGVVSAERVAGQRKVAV
jgi:NADH-quinone oxidoreductase subunit G